MCKWCVVHNSACGCFVVHVIMHHLVLMAGLSEPLGVSLRKRAAGQSPVACVRMARGRLGGDRLVCSGSYPLRRVVRAGYDDARIPLVTPRLKDAGVLLATLQQEGVSGRPRSSGASTEVPESEYPTAAPSSEQPNAGTDSRASSR